MYCRTGQKVLSLFLFSFIFLFFSRSHQSHFLFCFSYCPLSVESKCQTRNQCPRIHSVTTAATRYERAGTYGVVSSFSWWWLIASLRFSRYISVADPDLQIRGGGRSSRPWQKEAAVSKKFFSALRAAVWSKNKGGGLPWIRLFIYQYVLQAI